MVARYEALQVLYAISHASLYAHLLAGHIRAVAQRRHDNMLHGSLLLYRLPHVIRHLEHRRHGALPSGDVESAVRALAAFPGLAVAELSPGIPWFTALARVLSELRLIGKDFVVEYPPVALPPLLAHTDSLVCTTTDDFVRVVDRLCSEASGADLTTDLAPELLELALVQGATVSRVQGVVVQRLIPPLLDPEFDLCLPTLNACVSKLATPAVVEIIAMHGQLATLTTLLLELWSVRVRAWPTAIPADDGRQYLHAVEVVSRAQLILLYIAWRFGPPSAELVDFQSSIISNSPTAAATASYDDVKDVGFALANVLFPFLWHWHLLILTTWDVLRWFRSSRLIFPLGAMRFDQRPRPSPLQR